MEDILRNDIQACLDKLTSKLTQELGEVILKDVPANAYLIEFVFESMAFVNTFPVRWYIYTQHEEELAEGQLLENENRTFPMSLLCDQKYEETRLKPHTIASEMFIEWFADCWHKVGGAGCGFSAYLTHHDSIHYFDLTKRESVTGERLGFE